MHYREQDLLVRIQQLEEQLKELKKAQPKLSWNFSWPRASTVLLCMAFLSTLLLFTLGVPFTLGILAIDHPEGLFGLVIASLILGFAGGMVRLEETRI